MAHEIRLDKGLLTSDPSAALSLHAAVASNFRKTAANFHYEFNIRHLAGVFWTVTNS